MNTSLLDDTLLGRNILSGFILFFVKLSRNETNFYFLTILPGVLSPRKYNLNVEKKIIYVNVLVNLKHLFHIHRYNFYSFKFSCF